MQLDEDPDALESYFEMALHKLAAGPGNWASVGDLCHLKSAFFFEWVCESEVDVFGCKTSGHIHRGHGLCWGCSSLLVAPSTTLYKNQNNIKPHQKSRNSFKKHQKAINNIKKNQYALKSNKQNINFKKARKSLNKHQKTIENINNEPISIEK